MRDFAPNDTIGYTKSFLQNTGLTRGITPRMRFTVRACSCNLCRSGEFVATNSPTMMYDSASDPEEARYFHINKRCVHIIGTLHAENS